MAIIRDEHEERLVRIEQMLETLRLETERLRVLAQGTRTDTRATLARWDGKERRKRAQTKTRK